MTHHQASSTGHRPNMPLPLGPTDSDHPESPIPVVTTATRVDTRDAQDPDLVDQTRNQIRQLVQEIESLSRSDCAPDDFYAGFLTRVTRALASMGGALWIRDSADQPLQLKYHINLKNTGLVDDPNYRAQHDRLLIQTLDQAEATIVSPDSANEADNQTGNPTSLLLVLGPLHLDGQPIGLVEIFQRPGAGPTTQRGYIRFVNQMCDLANIYLREQRVRSILQQQNQWRQFEQLVKLLHQDLDLSSTVYTLANEARRLIDCDRVSVALCRGRRCQVTAVSGLDSIERRADQVKQLGDLATAVVKTGQAFWYQGNNAPLPPQIEGRLQDYLDRAHSKLLAIIPLFPPEPEAEASQPARRRRDRRPVGALIVEQLSDSRRHVELDQRVQLVVDHGQLAIANAQSYNGIFLMPLWRTLGKLTSWVQPGNRWKTTTAALLLAAGISCLALFPYEFGLGANGRLIPQTQYEVFAQSDGTMDSILVSDTGDTLVEQGQLLGSMKNSDIELAISGIRGQIAEAQSQIANNSRHLSMGGLKVDDRVEIESRILRDRQTVTSLEQELDIRLQEQQLLNIVSPGKGRVVTWNAKQNLTNRPVQRGQNLMTIVPPDTIWELELELPERRLAHLLRAVKTSPQPLPVTFGLVSNPGTEYHGTLISVDRKLDVYSEDGNAALLRVAFANPDLDQALLRSETRVSAKILCGQRSLGYVMFHELLETIQSKWIVWF